MPHGRLTGLDNISRGEGRVTEDTIRVSSEIKDSWGRRYRLSGVREVEFSPGFQVQNANGLFAGGEDPEYIAHK